MDTTIMNCAWCAKHMTKRIASSTICACIVCTAVFPVLLARAAWAQQNALVQPATTSPKTQRIQAAIVTAAVERSPQDGAVKNIAVTGPSMIGIRKVLDVQEAEEGNTRWSNGVLGRDGDIDGDPTATYYTVNVETDAFSDEQYVHLVVKVGDKLFAPFSYGGSGGGVNTTFELRNVDKASAEALCGSKLPSAPKSSITATFEPREVANGVENAVRIDITLTNVGKTPLSLSWGTVGASNRAARDTQLFFTATREGATGGKAPVPATILPDGYIRSSTQLMPKASLHRSENAAQWFQTDKAGTYRVGASYKVLITNPEAGAFPSQWTVVYHDTFTVSITQITK